MKQQFQITCRSTAPTVPDLKSESEVKSDPPAMWGSDGQTSSPVWVWGPSELWAMPPRLPAMGQLTLLLLLGAGNWPSNAEGKKFVTHSWGQLIEWLRVFAFPAHQYLLLFQIFYNSSIFTVNRFKYRYRYGMWWYLRSKKLFSVISEKKYRKIRIFYVVINIIIPGISFARSVLWI